jgi:alpha-ketoglutarate-dependent taurine dioxygenase
MENITLPLVDAAVEAGVVRRFLDDVPQPFPLVLEPSREGIDLIGWLEAHRPEFEQDLQQYGGILLRGFGINTVERFNRFMQCFDTTPLPYMFRSSPRAELDEKIRNIYRSTSYPNDRSINLHNESSYSRVWGMKIAFCCLQPAAEGGETPIADSRRVLRSISPALLEKFREKGVKYWRHLSPGLGMPWQEVFQTDKQEIAEDICTRNGINFEWKGDTLYIDWVKPAVYTHPKSGEDTWFNHVLFFHRFSRYEELDLPYDEYLPDEYLSSQTFFGDGSDISYQEFAEIKRAYQANTISFPYLQGDIIFLDNMLAAHGRTPYKGDRTIATAIVEAAYDARFLL